MLPAILRTVAKAVGCVLTVAVALLYTFQDKLLYFPNPPNFPKTNSENQRGGRSPSEYNKDGSRGAITDPIPFEETFVRTPDGVDVHIWLMLQDNSENVPTLIYFHGILTFMSTLSHFKTRYISKNDCFE